MTAGRDHFYRELHWLNEFAATVVQDKALVKMLDWWRLRKARESAVAAIRPYLEYSVNRVGRHSLDNLNPYAVGFLGMLITLVAQYKYPSLGTRTIGLLQMEAWAELTKNNADLIGQEISFLSLNADPDFQGGCYAAKTFFDEILRKELDGRAFGDVQIASQVQSDQISAETMALERWVALYECGTQ
ncbi:MAG: hypothetical protein ABJN26_16380 [Stappiaceae bacterium]